MERKRQELTIGRRVAKKFDGDYGWEVVKPDEIDTTKPMIFCLGGGGVLQDRDANGMAKTAQHFLGVDLSQLNTANIYSVFYGSFEDKPLETDIKSDEIIAVMRGIFEPLVSKDGKKIDPKIAAKNVRRVNLMSHCLGGLFANLLAAETADMMYDELGYSEKEIRSILKNCTNVVYAPYKGQMSNLFTNIGFCSFNDRAFKEDYKKIFKTNKFLGAGKTFLDKKQNNLALFANSFIGEDPDLFIGTDEHLISTIKRDEKFLVNKNVDIEENPEFLNLIIENVGKKEYLDQPDPYLPRTDLISKLFAYSIAECLSNSILNEASKKLVPLHLEDIKRVMDYHIAKHNQSNFEKRQKKFFDEFKMIEKIRKQTQNNFPSVKDIAPKDDTLKRLKQTTTKPQKQNNDTPHF